MGNFNKNFVKKTLVIDDLNRLMNVIFLNQNLPIYKKKDYRIPQIVKNY